MIHLSRSLFFVVLILAVLTLSHDVVVAQEAADEASSSESGERETKSIVPRKVGAWHPYPHEFSRGNFHNQASRSGKPGSYISMPRMIILIAFFLLWVKTSNWASIDSRKLKVRPEYWATMLVACGFPAIILSLSMPAYLVTLLVAAAGIGVPLGLYIAERNGRVPDGAKVMTPDHIQKVIKRTLGKYGIAFGGDDGDDYSGGPPIKFIGKTTTQRGEEAARSKSVEGSPGYLSAKELVYDAVLRRCTDIHLEPKEDELSVRLRIDGVMYPSDPFDIATGSAILNIFKVLGAMDITEKRRPQDGSFRAEMEGNRKIDFRIATQGTRFGEKMSLRLLDHSSDLASLAGLGLRKQLLGQMQELIQSPHGMILAAGPTGAGKSTTLYAALSEIDAYQQNIITVEDPIEYKIDNVNQIEINTKSGQTFATALRSILRQDPDTVMIGEIRDKETADIACQAANTGHMVFSTVHANDSVTALYRMLELGVEPFMIANSVTAIIGQRLTRRLCPECRVAYKPNPEILKKLGLSNAKIQAFFRPPPEPDYDCPKCSGLGYLGRIGVFEVMVVTDTMRDMLREKANVTAFKKEARKNGMLYMKEEGLRLVARGITSLEELQRVVK